MGGWQDRHVQNCCGEVESQQLNLSKPTKVLHSGNRVGILVTEMKIRDPNEQQEQVGIGHRLSAAMALRGYTPAHLAGLTGVNRQTIWRYQTGRSTQSLLGMAKLARALRVRLDYLAYGDGKLEKGGRQ